MKNTPMHTYWLIWFFGWFSSFIVPEMQALATGHPENTLSDAIWYAEKLIPGQAVVDWTFFHFAFTAVFIFAAVWLTGHFGWGLWK